MCLNAALISYENAFLFDLHKVLDINCKFVLVVNRFKVKLLIRIINVQECKY